MSRERPVELFLLVPEPVKVEGSPGDAGVVRARHDSRYLLQPLGEIRRVLAAPLALRIEGFHLRDEDGRLILCHAALGDKNGVAFPMPRHDAAFRAAEVVEGIAAIHQLLIMSEDGPSLAAGEGFPVPEAEAAQVPEGPDFAAFPLAAVGLAGVFDDLEVVLLRDGVDAVHVADAADDVDRQNGDGVPGDLGRDLGRVDLPGLRIDVHEDRPGIGKQNGMDTRYEGVRCGDDFIPRPNAESADGSE